MKKTKKPKYPKGIKPLPNEWLGSDGYFHWEKKNPRTGEIKRIKRKNLMVLRDEVQKIEKAWESGSDYSLSFKSFSDLFDRWIETKKTKKHSTYLTYKNAYYRYIHDTLGKYDINAVNSINIEEFLKDLYFGKHISYSVTVRCYTIIKGMFTQAKKDGIYLKENPAIYAIDNIKEHYKNLTSSTESQIIDGVESEHKKSDWCFKEKTVLTEREVMDLCNYLYSLEDKTNYIIITVLLGTGIRVGELCGLRWSDIDFENGYINIRRNISYMYEVDDDGEKGKTRYSKQSPKNNKERKIPMTSEVKKSLEMQKKITGNIKIEEILGIDDFVFLTRKMKRKYGKPMTPVLISKRITRLVNNASKNCVECRKFSPHDTRHTFETRLAEYDVPYNVRAYVLGHKLGNITDELYTHLDNDDYIKNKFIEFESKYSLLEGRKSN